MTTFRPPAIPPQCAGTERPRWSVMIPTFNCAAYLRKTLRSVLAQDPGPRLMQIEVVDDCSTKDDPATVVNELSPEGRVAFHRRSLNGGATANFNTCLERSRGDLVHVLHGDDAVQPGFYSAIDTLAAKHPQVALYATRALVVDGADVVYSVSPMLPSEGLLLVDDEFFYRNPFYTPAVVVRRIFYETHGGFDPSFPHAADWELWLRVLRLGGGAVTRETLVRYRLHRDNDTSRLTRTAGNLEDMLRLFLWHRQLQPRLDARRMRRELGAMALVQARSFKALKQAEAYDCNRRFFWRMFGRIGGVLYLLQIRIGRLAEVAMPRNAPNV